MPLSEALKQRVINDYFPRYPTKRAALMPTLWLAQDELGWLSTDTMVEIEGENMRGVTWVVVEEVKSGEWGIGGQALTTEDVQALAAGAAA